MSDNKCVVCKKTAVKTKGGICLGCGCEYNLDYRKGIKDADKVLREHLRSKTTKLEVR